MQQKMKMMVQRIEQLESEKTTDAAVVREAKQGSQAPSPPQSNPSGSGGLGNRCWSESDRCRPLIQWDLPTGAAIVCTFGITLLLVALVKRVVNVA